MKTGCCKDLNSILSQLVHLMKLAWWLFLTFFALVLWQPVTAACKFYRDGKFETSVGMEKVEKRKGASDCRKNGAFDRLLIVAVHPAILPKNRTFFMSFGFFGGFLALSTFRLCAMFFKNSTFGSEQ